MAIYTIKSLQNKFSVDTIKKFALKQMYGVREYGLFNRFWTLYYAFFAGVVCAGKAVFYPKNVI